MLAQDLRVFGGRPASRYPRPLQTERSSAGACPELQTGPPTLDPRNGLAQYSWPPNATGQGPVTEDADEKEGEKKTGKWRGTQKTGPARSVRTSPPTRGRAACVSSHGAFTTRCPDSAAPHEKGREVFGGDWAGGDRRFVRCAYRQAKEALARRKKQKKKAIKMQRIWLMGKTEQEETNRKRVNDCLARKSWR